MPKTRAVIDNPFAIALNTIKYSDLEQDLKHFLSIYKGDYSDAANLENQKRCQHLISALKLALKPAIKDPKQKINFSLPVFSDPYCDLGLLILIRSLGCKDNIATLSNKKLACLIQIIKAIEKLYLDKLAVYVDICKQEIQKREPSAFADDLKKASLRQAASFFRYGLEKTTDKIIDTVGDAVLMVLRIP